MKELYISPELNVACFAPVEKLSLTFDDLLDPGDDSPSAGGEQDGDFGFDLDL